MSMSPNPQDIDLWRKARRPELIARRLAMPAAERAAASARITARLNAGLADAPGRLVGFYWPFKGEYDPRPVVRALHQAGVALALPVVVAKAQPLIFRPWWPGAPMTQGVWSIPIPADGEPVQPDTLLVPLVGFDSENYRLGYGGGFYDRTIAAMPSRPRTIGIGFACARLATIYPQPYDIPMDEVVIDEHD
jgi:5-formyltetrahydrofolate cyclo-ligase